MTIIGSLFYTVLEGFFNATYYVQAHWTVWAEYVGWGLGVASVLQYVKRKYKIDEAKGFSFLGWWQMDGPRIMTALYGFVAAASAALTWLIDPSNRAYIPDRFAFLVTTGVAVHRFIVSPLGRRIEAKLAPYVAALNQLQTMEQNYPQNTQGPTVVPTSAGPITPRIDPNDTVGR